MVDAAKAVSAGSAVHDEAPDNRCYRLGHRRQGRHRRGDSSRRAHVTTLSFRNNRLIPNAIEPRAANASYDANADSYTLYVANQNPHVERLLMCAFVLGIPEHKMRVVAPDVGGGFGSKIYLYGEETALVFASKQIRRPIKWTCRPFRGLPVRRARPRPCHHRQAGARQGRQVPRACVSTPPPTLGAYLSTFASSDPDDPVRHAAGRPVQDAEDLRRSHRRVHQHRAGGRLPRRRPPRGHLCGRAHRRDGGARDEDRPGRDPPAQLHHRVPVCVAGRPDLRHRRLQRHAQPAPSNSATWPASPSARPPAKPRA